MPNFFAQRALLLTWLITLLSVGVYASDAAVDAAASIYLFVAATFQASLLLIPLLILHAIQARIGKSWLAIPIVVLSFASLVLLFANYKVHSMYSFFIDGFVLNLLTTPGGIDALGLSPSFYTSAINATLMGGIAFFVVVRFLPTERLLSFQSKKMILSMGFLTLFVAEASTNAWASYTYRTDVLSVSEKIVWHIPVTARKFFQRLGIESSAPKYSDIKYGFSGQFSYPATTTPIKLARTPYNIIWLTAESLRHDMLNSLVMPNAFAFAEKNSWFKSHYSGGNGTRMGMFSQFYGLYPSYWKDVLHGRQSPLIIDTLLANDYNMKAFTSARFTYPEFDKTIFSRLSQQQLQEFYTGVGWQRDEKNTEDIVRHITNVAGSEAPFFTFMFFESAHANYYFPKQYAIEKDYIEDFDYLSVNIADNIKKIKNRYVNASHYLDSRLGIIFDTLKDQGLYDNTIVIVTGDHGEEFMEKGRWGHNSTFVQEQIRVPLIIHIPGKPAQVYNNMTSHLDIPASVLNALGYDIDPRLHSFGEDLFSTHYSRKYTVAGDWHGNTLITPTTKFILSIKGSSNSMSLSTLNDSTLDPKLVSPQDKAALAEFIYDMPRFHQGSASFKQNTELARSQPTTTDDNPVAHL